MRRALALAVALVLAPPSPQAQAPAPLSLAEAQARARSVSPALEEARALARAFEAALAAARAERRPRVDLLAGYTRLSDVPELRIPLPDGTARTIFPNVPDNLRARVEFALPLTTGGRLEAAAEGVAAAEASSAAARLAATESDVALEVTTAYWDLVTARATEQVLAQALEAYEQHLRDALHREEVGVAARNDRLAVQVERDRAELARLQAASAAEIAATRLGRLVGSAPGEVLVPADELTLPAEPPAEPIEPLVAAALAARPERRSLEAGVEAAAAGVEVRRSVRRPQVSVGGGWDLARPNREILPVVDRWEDTWDVSLSLSQRLWDGGRAAADVARAQALLEAARRRLDDFDTAVRLEVTSRALELRTALAGVEVTERNVEAARENRRVSHDRYVEGVSPSSELLDAEVLLLRADLDHTEALARVRLARARLDRSLGR